MTCGSEGIEGKMNTTQFKTCLASLHRLTTSMSTKRLSLRRRLTPTSFCYPYPTTHSPRAKSLLQVSPTAASEQRVQICRAIRAQDREAWQRRGGLPATQTWAWYKSTCTRQVWNRVSYPNASQIYFGLSAVDELDPGDAIAAFDGFLRGSIRRERW